jgi:5-methylcytosine-specific restriction protein A
MSGFYLSLNQGWTQYKQNFTPVSQARIEVEKNALKLKKTLKTVSGFSFNKIDLKAGKSDLAQGYELGNICSVYYDIQTLPNSMVLINDLQKLIGVYRELKALVGLNILDIDLVLDEDEFQTKSQTAKPRKPKPGKVSKKKKVNGSSSSSWLRDPDMAFTAIEKADFKCENDVLHETFISSSTDHQFVEAHHLIPMEFQDDFEASIDVPENIISLCPNCHRAFHNSINEVKTKLISKFYDSRIILLKEREIFLSKEKLLDLYKV